MSGDVTTAGLSMRTARVKLILQQQHPGLQHALSELYILADFGLQISQYV